MIRRVRRRVSAGYLGQIADAMALAGSALAYETDAVRIMIYLLDG